MGGFLAVAFGLGAVLALMRRSIRKFWACGLVSAAAGGTMICMFSLNYWVTGLATDQGLDLTWRFANLERLDQWGVIPQLVVVAWIRDNYAGIAPALGWKTIVQLRHFMRLHALWPLVLSGVIALGLAAYFRRCNGDHNTSSARKVLTGVGLFIGALILLSAVAGRSQAISYFRFSTFFFPLIVLFLVACWAFMIVEWRERAGGWILRVVVPGLLLIAVPLWWQKSYKWIPQARTVTAHALQFAAGRYSLADAYRHQEGRGGLEFGAIYPGALAAMRQLDQGTRIWSTNVDSYCLAPECRIESVVSFKMSRHMNDILNGTPAQARRILEEEGLNYFLFSKDFNLLDMLPYSRLFAPEAIVENLGVKWTDGTTYLLTWRGRGTVPIGSDFLEAYRTKLSENEHQWFVFSKVLPHIEKVATTLEATPRPWRPMEFPWRKR